MGAHVSTVKEFRELLLALAQRGASVLREDSSCCGVTVSQCIALQHLLREGQMTAGDLARSMGVDASTVTRTTDALVREGHVERVRPETGDRRRVLLRLTAPGLSLARDLVRREEQFLEQALGRFDQDAVRGAIEVLGGLLALAGGGLEGYSIDPQKTGRGPGACQEQSDA
jgi:DNA-binding MarR family transcriptional regulator